jgi:hypothetical protein
VPDALDLIGMARLCSRHIVLRGIDPGAEYAAFRSAFDTLTPAERDEVLLVRRAHAEEALFLHEWGHSLGLIHVHRAGALMSPNLSSDSAGFSANERRLIEIARRHQVEEGVRWVEGARTELARVMAELRDPDWNLAERDLRPAPTASQPGAAVPPGPKTEPELTPEPALIGADRDTYLEAVALERRGRVEEATLRLAFIEKRHPRSSEVKLLSCRLAWRRPPDAVRAPLVEAACPEATRLARGDPRPWLYLAELEASARQLDTAKASLAHARERIDGLEPADAEVASLMAQVADQIAKLERAAGPSGSRAPGRAPRP